MARRSSPRFDWLVFPSVTAAVLAAMAMQEELRLAQPVAVGLACRQPGRGPHRAGRQLRLEGLRRAGPDLSGRADASTRVIADQYIVFTDLRDFSRLMEGPLTTVERVLDRLFELVNQIARELGTVRFNAGDAYCLTFGDADTAVAVAERIGAAWATFLGVERLTCPVNIPIHQGVV